MGALVYPGHRRKHSSAAQNRKPRYSRDATVKITKTIIFDADLRVIERDAASSLRDRILGYDEKRREGRLHGGVAALRPNARARTRSAAPITRSGAASSVKTMCCPTRAENSATLRLQSGEMNEAARSAQPPANAQGRSEGPDLVCGFQRRTATA